MTGGEQGGLVGWDVGVAVYEAEVDAALEAPAFDDAIGGPTRARHATGRSSMVIEKGQEAVRIATEAIAEQIGITAQRIADSIDRSAPAAAEPGQLGVDSVEVSFGISLKGGIQTLFTAEGETSATVTITLTRQPPARAAGAA